MFMSAMGGGNLLSSWSTASYVVRAVASKPTGPFTAVQDVLPAFHHNPQVVRAPDGTFLLFTIGQTLASESQSAGASASGGAVFRTELHYAADITGPWQSLGCVINGSNPSPHVMANGTIVVAYKSKPNGLRIATASHWRGPYTTLTQPGAKNSCCGAASSPASCCGEILLSPMPYGHPYIEDFFLWFDQNAERWAIVLHQYELPNRGMGPGGFAYSTDASLLSPWHLANESVYGLDIVLANRSTLHADRQRPKLLFVREGKPKFLYNGLDPGGQKAPTHTVVQEIKSWSPPYDTSATRDAPQTRGAR